MKFFRAGLVLRASLLALIALFFSCALASTALAAGPNLLLNNTLTQTNPTDTTLPLAWHRGGWGVNQPTYSYPVSGFNDAAAVSVALTSHTNGDVKWYTDHVSVTAGASYLFTNRYQATVPTIITAEYRLNTGAVQYQYLLTLPATSTWAEARINITIPAGVTSVTIYHLLNQVGSLTFDSPSLTKNDPVPPPPDPGNLIVNGSFETSSVTDPTLPNNWSKAGWGTSQAAFSYPVAGHTSANAAAITLSSYTDGDVKWRFTPIATTTSRSLTYSEYYKATVPTFVTVDYEMNDGSHRYVDIANLTAVSDWTKAQATFTPPTGLRSLTIYHLLNRVGSLTLDSARLEITSAAPPSDPTNLIVNASLSQASPTDPNLPVAWSKGDWGTQQAIFTYPVAGATTANGLEVTLTSHTSGDAKWTFDAVPVTPGLIYRYSEFYKSTVPSFITARFDSVNGTSSYTDLMRLPPTSTWAAVQVPVSPPTGVVKMTIFHLIEQVGTLTTSGFLLPQPATSSMSTFSEGMVSLTYDDGYLSGYEVARPMLNQAGIKASFYLVNDYLDGSDPFYMDTTQALALNRDGHEVGSHTQTHPFLTELLPAQLLRETVTAKLGLLALGFTPVQTFVYPYGDYNNTVIQSVKTAGFLGARSVHSGFNDKLTDPYLLMDQHVESNTTPAQVQTWIDQAKANKTWLILELHQQDYSNDQYSNTPETMQAIINIIKASNIKTVTMNEGLTLMRQ